MNKLLLVVALSAAAFGCKKKSSTPATAEQCASAGANTGKLMAPSVKAKKADIDVAAAEVELSADAHSTCLSDAWSEDVATCATKAKSYDEVGGCLEKLTKEQQDAFSKGITATVAKLATAPAATPPPAGDGSGSAAAPAAGSGSADGSAAAGSGSATGSGSAAPAEGSAGSGSGS
jgi:hypothetical protein